MKRASSETGVSTSEKSGEVSCEFNFAVNLRKRDFNKTLNDLNKTVNDINDLNKTFTSRSGRTNLNDLIKTLK